MSIIGNNQTALLGFAAIVTLLHLHLIGNDPKAMVLPRKMFASYVVQLVILMTLMLYHASKSS